MSMVFGCGMNWAQQSENCELRYQGCISQMNYETNQWDFIKTELQCDLNFQACMYHELPKTVSCDEIYLVCKEDVNWTYDRFIAQSKCFECDRGFERCIYHEYRVF